MTDLAAQLVVCRDLVQTFNQALGLLSDDDLHELPGSSSAASQRVSGSPTPPTPYNGDHGLPAAVLRALRQTHMAAIALCALDCVTDPLPFDEAPGVHRTSLPTLSVIGRHLDHLDRSLQEVQEQHFHFDVADIVVALDACEQLTWDAGTEHKQLNHPNWARMARRARRQCAWCHRMSPDAELCEVCSGDKVKCRGVGEDDCSRLVPRAHHRCPACRQRLSRERRKAA